MPWTWWRVSRPDRPLKSLDNANPPGQLGGFFNAPVGVTVGKALKNEKTF